MLFIVVVVVFDDKGLGSSQSDSKQLISAVCSKNSF